MEGNSLSFIKASFKTCTRNLFFMSACLLIVAARGLSSRCLASHCGGLSRCTVRAPGCPASAAVARGQAAPRPSAQAQRCWRTVHVASSQVRDRTRVSCIHRQTLHHWASREAQSSLLTVKMHSLSACNWDWARNVSYYISIQQGPGRTDQLNKVVKKKTRKKES